MPTLLDMCGLPIPQTVEGFSLAGQQRRDHLYGEHSEGTEATRMIRSGSFKLIYYPTGEITSSSSISKTIPGRRRIFPRSLAIGQSWIDSLTF